MTQLNPTKPTNIEHTWSKN